MATWRLSEDNAVRYVRERPELQALGGLGEETAIEVIRLGGGVSNIVLRIRSTRLDMVVKQALPKLNVAEEWLASVDRLDREVACLRFLEERLPKGTVPRLLFFDEGRHVYGMTTLPDSCVMWKSRLMEGDVDPALAKRIGLLLGEIHRLTWERKGIGDAFDDLAPFHQLRLDPYYRVTMERHPEVAAHFKRAIELATEHRSALVHGDFSPKNILVDGKRVVLLDYEVAHYGDPAFDVAFLINHLLLKAVYHPGLGRKLVQAVREFWRGYLTGLGWQVDGDQGRDKADDSGEGERDPAHDGRDGIEPGAAAVAELERRTILHLGCLHLARVDGKSPAEYLTTDVQRDQVRSQAQWILDQQDLGLGRVLAQVEARFARQE